MKIITSDWLDIQIAIFNDYADYKRIAKKEKLPLYDMPTGTKAFYQHCSNSETGEKFFLICFPHDKTSYQTILHETSHIADMIFEWTGIEPCTETEAYFHTWLFGEVLATLEKMVK